MKASHFSKGELLRSLLSAGVFAWGSCWVYWGKVNEVVRIADGSVVLMQSVMSCFLPGVFIFGSFMSWYLDNISENSEFSSADATLGVRSFSEFRQPIYLTSVFASINYLLISNNSPYWCKKSASKIGVLMSAMMKVHWKSCPSGILSVMHLYRYLCG